MIFIFSIKVDFNKRYVCDRRLSRSLQDGRGQAKSGAKDTLRVNTKVLEVPKARSQGPIAQDALCFLQRG